MLDKFQKMWYNIVDKENNFRKIEKLGFTTLEVAKEVNGQIFSDIQQTLALGGLTNGVINMELNIMVRRTKQY